MRNSSYWEQLNKKSYLNQQNICQLYLFASEEPMSRYKPFFLQSLQRNPCFDSPLAINLPTGLEIEVTKNTSTSQSNFSYNMLEEPRTLGFQVSKGLYPVMVFTILFLRSFPRQSPLSMYAPISHRGGQDGGGLFLCEVLMKVWNGSQNDHLCIYMTY